MNKDNIIKLNDISQKKTISIAKAAEILGLTYDTARRRIYNSGEIGFFDYGGGQIQVVEEDVRHYKINHYIKPSKEK